MIRVLIADDEELIRVALAQLLNLEDDVDVVAQAADGRDAVESAARHRPDVAVVDLDMPRLDGMGVAAELARALPTCRTVILTGRGRPVHLPAALAAGARGFVVKGASAATLADVIRRVHGGQRYVDPALAADALSLPPSPLTERERDVLRLAARGMDVAGIALRLHLARGTVRNVLTACRQKLGSVTVADAARDAEASGWI
ncbi:response regulator transcription factor [Microbacterium lushaniae]|uniref:Response regulator transcription factor n=1 Tax=Microbacterium lushaniae TaxID=2614639 RepID=A0A5J6L0T7_9MICO|nr:response regulator transcription factor [Microbacterium lushaniae]QEW02042.1 response regulator transcription factor [Microbacterium lushaniae]